MNETEDRYRQEWAGRTGRTPRDIYVPEALREEPAVPTENPSAKFELSFPDDEVVTVELEFKFSDNAEDFIDVTQFVNLAAEHLLQGMVGDQHV